ncbi:hypothetical protein [Kordia jejudonensis]|uniref:hypothetical protein n=1 Tax=Kordia jejudonensis TaxID=1348245 RepID=UPI0006299075|nr:hypothetical protein [Kordia jejudonensis]
MKSKLLYIILIGFLFIQCDGNKNNTENKLLGKYYTLDKFGVELFVPSDVELITLEQYKKDIEEIKNPQVKQSQLAQYHEIANQSNKKYLLRNKSKTIRYFFEEMPHVEINRDISSYILTRLEKEHQRNASLMNMTASIEKSSIKRRNGNTMFRALFLYQGDENSMNAQRSMLTYCYILNMRGRTFVATIISKDEQYFDEYMWNLKL